MPDNSVSLVGNITRDPELRFHPGRPGRGHLRHGGEPPLPEERSVGRADVVLQRPPRGERSARTRSNSLHKGARVLVTGRLEQRSWETQEGEKRSVVEVIADEVGPSLRWATVEITKNERREGDSGGGGGGSRPASNEPAPAYTGGDEEPF